jgi:5-methylcytosine-specific restriction enzyme subunit McrC
MQRVMITEHTRLYRWDGEEGGAVTGQRIASNLYERLRRFDQRNRREGEQIFLWKDGYAVSQHWVGVVQVEGLQVEIIPKIDTPQQGREESKEESEGTTRKNLLYMLTLAGKLPLRERDLAHLSSEKASLLEILARAFARRLQELLQRGAPHAYQEHHENLSVWKGKLSVSQHIQRNAAHRERFFCRYDVFSMDTKLNQVLKAGCRLLLGWTKNNATRESLGRCLGLLDDVTDRVILAHDLDNLSLTRQEEDFADVFSFCKMLLRQQTPNLSAGYERSFSLLFNMNQIFEQFIAAFFGRYIVPHFRGMSLHRQGKAKHHHLMREKQSGRGVVRLLPDLLLEAVEGDQSKRLILDTKWKRLGEQKTAQMGVSREDLYQLFAYTTRYGCERSILLYPWMAGQEERDFCILTTQEEASGAEVSIRSVRLDGDLSKSAGRESLIASLVALLCEMGFTYTAREAA